MQVDSAGIRRLYRHVDMLVRNGYKAAILHTEQDFRIKDQPDVPVKYIRQDNLEDQDIVVIPEGFPNIMDALKNAPFRRFVIALNWSYIFSTLPNYCDWRSFNIERAIVVSPVVGRFILWSMGIPVHLLHTSINHDRFMYDPDLKRKKIVCIKRKAGLLESLKKVLWTRNREYIEKVNGRNWRGCRQRNMLQRFAIRQSF